jgi:PAS domain S-box-containing protein
MALDTMGSSSSAGPSSLFEAEPLATMARVLPGAVVSLRYGTDGSISMPFATQAIEGLLGATSADLAERPFVLRERFSAAEWVRLADALAHAALALAPLRSRWWVAHPARGEVHVEICAGAVREADGATTWHGVMLEVTSSAVPTTLPPRSTLPQSGSFLGSILETTPALILSVDRDLRVRFINRVSEHRLEDVLGADVRRFMTEASRPIAEAAIRKVFDTGLPETYEVEGVAASGDVRRYTTHVGPVVEDGAVTSVTLAVTDVTERQRIERELRASEERFRGLVELFPHPIFIHQRGLLRYGNPAFKRLLGAEPSGRPIPAAVRDFVHPEHHDFVRDRIAQVNETQAPAEEAEIAILTLDGVQRRVKVEAIPIVDQGQDAILVTFHDVTEEARTRGLLESIMRSVRDAIITSDDRGNVMMINPSTTELFGFVPAELVGHNVKELMPEPFRSEHDEHLRSYSATGIGRVMGSRREVVGQRKDGSTFPVEVSLTEFRLGGRLHFTAVARDLTERKRLEDQFRQAHKMEAFGQLAGGVAHDFNNLLTVILGETELLASTLSNDKESVASLGDIRDAAERAAVLTKQLLVFSRKTVLEPKILDVNTVIHETEKMLRRLIGEDIRFVSKLATGLPLVNVDPGQLTQILMNLAVNARDAMPKGGELEIATAAVLLEDGAAYGARPGRYVRLSVRDSGSGMTEEVQHRVFQPFFTTKEVGKGTGLGLAVVHGIVTQSGGGIRVQSKVGHGSTFELIFPAATAPLLGLDAERERAPQAFAGTVLLVEDDESVRRFAMRILSMNGYRVIVAADGVAAMSMLETNPDPVRLVITDVVMPGMDGADLGEKLRSKTPTLRVLYVSGYTEEALSVRGLRSESIDFLPKPYTAQSLLDAVGRVLTKA